MIFTKLGIKSHTTKYIAYCGFQEQSPIVSFAILNLYYNIPKTTKIFII